MLKLTEKYADKPAAELPMLFQRIVQNTIHDHFRRQKVRSTWTTLLSALGKGDEKDDDFDPLETLAAKSDSNATADPAAQFEQAQIIGVIEQALGAAAGASTGSVSAALLGRTRCGGNRRRDGLLGRQRQDPLLARGARPGRDAQGQRSVAMTTDDRRFRKENNHLPRPRHGRSQGRHRLSAAARPGRGARAPRRSRSASAELAAARWRGAAAREPSAAAAASGPAAGSGSGSLDRGRRFRLSAVAGLSAVATTSRKRTPRSCPRTCRSMPTWTGDSRIG